MVQTADLGNGHDLAISVNAGLKARRVAGRLKSAAP